jgi:hypothetical protein
VGGAQVSQMVQPQHTHAAKIGRRVPALETNLLPHGAFILWCYFPYCLFNMFLRKFELAFLHRGINKKKIKKRKSRQKKFGLSFVRSHRFSHQKNQKKKIKKKKTPNFARRTQSFPNC